MDNPRLKSQKKTSILVKVVDNGFIVEEDFQEFNHHTHVSPTINSKKVFNTKKQLYNYIGENL